MMAIATGFLLMYLTAIYLPTQHGVRNGRRLQYCNARDFPFGTEFFAEARGPVGKIP